MITLISPAQWAKKHGFSRQYAYQLIEAGVIHRVNPLGQIDEAQSDRSLAYRRAQQALKKAAAERDCKPVKKRSSPFSSTRLGAMDGGTVDVDEEGLFLTLRMLEPLLTELLEVCRTLGQEVTKSTSPANPLEARAQIALLETFRSKMLPDKKTGTGTDSGRGSR